MSIRDSLPVCAGVLALSCAPAIAATDPSFEIEEIVVTALRGRDEPCSRRRWPSPRFSGETLEKRSLDNVTDLLRSCRAPRSLDQGTASASSWFVASTAPAKRSPVSTTTKHSIPGAPSTTNDAGQRMPELRSVRRGARRSAARSAGHAVRRSSMGGTVRALFNKPTSDFEAQLRRARKRSKRAISVTRRTPWSTCRWSMSTWPLRVVGYHVTAAATSTTDAWREDIDTDETSGGRLLCATRRRHLTIDAAAFIQRQDAFISAWELPSGRYQTAVPTQLPVGDDFELYSLTLAGISASRR